MADRTAGGLLEIWPSLLETAWAQRRAGPLPTTDMWYTVANGRADLAYEALTGQNVDSEDVTIERFATAASALQWIADAKAEGRQVMVSTNLSNVTLVNGDEVLTPYILERDRDPTNGTQFEKPFINIKGSHVYNVLEITGSGNSWTMKLYNTLDGGTYDVDAIGSLLFVDGFMSMVIKTN